jgi:hypothetical protein
MSEQIIQLGDGLNDLRQENAVLQQQVDSLRLCGGEAGFRGSTTGKPGGVPLVAWDIDELPAYSSFVHFRLHNP